MTKQEKVRKGLIQIVGDKLHDHAYNRQWDDNATHDLISKEEPIVDAVLKYLHSQGVVIKGKDQTIQVSLPADGIPSGLKVPYHLSNLGENIAATESLIEEN